MAQVSLKGVTKSYGATHVIKGVDIEVADGEFCVFVGPSGCGKSTLLRMVAGLEDISGGELRIGGRLVNELPPKDRAVAMVFQSYAIFPHMSVRDNVGFGLSIAGAPKAVRDAKIAEAARILQMEHLLDRMPAQLSGGHRQRVGTLGARARLGVRPQYLVPVHGDGVDLAPGAGRLHGQVVLTERLGAETVVEVRLTDSGRVIAALPRDAAFSVGEPVTLAFRPEEAHLFPA